MLPTGTVLQESTVPLFWNDGAISAGFFTKSKSNLFHYRHGVAVEIWFNREHEING